MFKSGPRPNGAAVVKRGNMGDRRLHRRRARGPYIASLRPEEQQPAHDRLARSAALVRDRCGGRAGLPVHPRALDGAGGPPAQSRRHRALVTAFGRRAWPRHRPLAPAALRRLRRRRAGRDRLGLRQGQECLANRGLARRDVLQSGDRACSCRHRRARPCRNHQPPNGLP